MIQVGKEEVKLSQFADDVIVYTENPKDTTQKLSEIINEFSKTAGYKMYRNLLHFYTLTMNSQKEKSFKNSIYNHIKIIKYLEINLTMEVYNLYLENYKTLMKEIKDNTKKWKDILYSWIRTTNIVKMAILPKATYRFSAIPITIQWHFSHT